MRVLLVLVLLLVTGWAGCTDPGPAPPGWQTDPGTGVAWRPLTADEMAQWHFDDAQRGYVTRVPGLIERLREDDTVTVPVRVYGEVVSVDLAFREVRKHQVGGDDPYESTSRSFDVEGPWSGAWLSMPDTFHMEGWLDGWRYVVWAGRDEFQLDDDVRRDDLVTQARSPCEEWSEPGGNASAACVHHAEVEGY